MKKQSILHLAIGIILILASLAIALYVIRERRFAEEERRWSDDPRNWSDDVAPISPLGENNSPNTSQ
jgi:hypothetical protein